MLRSLKGKSGKGGYGKGSLGEEVSITLIVTKYEIRKYFGDHLAKNMVKKMKKKN